MISSKTLAFLLVLTSALVHASWNVAARSLKGNMSILMLAHLVGALMSLPFVILYGDFFNSVSDGKVFYYLIPSVFFHSSYIGLLAVAYFYGDVGLVYPLARGTAITLATIAVETLGIGIGNRLSMLENVGVVVVICGILTLACDAYRNILSTKDYSKLPSDSESDAVYEDDIEMSPNTPRNPLHDKHESSPNHDHDCDHDRKKYESLSEFAYEEDHRGQKKVPSEPDVETDAKSPVTKIRKGSYVPSLDSPVSRSSDIRAKKACISGPMMPTVSTAVVDPGDDESEVKDLTRKVSYSILFAVLVGCCTAFYSINDSFAVNTVPAITYSFMFNCSVGLVYLPYLLMYKLDELKDAFVNKWMYLLLMAPATTGAYLIILFVFEIPGVNLALVVALREFSVLIGTLLGIFVLKERASGLKVTAVIVICIGMALLKLG